MSWEVVRVPIQCSIHYRSNHANFNFLISHTIVVGHYYTSSCQIVGEEKAARTECQFFFSAQTLTHLFQEDNNRFSF